MGTGSTSTHCQGPDRKTKKINYLTPKNNGNAKYLKDNKEGQTETRKGTETEGGQHNQQAT